MEDVLKQMISGVIGVITGIISTVLYNKMSEVRKKRQDKLIKKSLSTINIFADYAELKEVIPIVSFEDTEAIQIAPLFQSGIYILTANINLINKPDTRDGRNFVMALLKYIPEVNWKYYCESGYKFKFKIRGNIRGVQIEIKNNRMQKVIDEYIIVSENFEEKVLQLKGDSSIWESVEEICFTVFGEEKYVKEVSGRFEIIDCKLEK